MTIAFWWRRSWCGSLVVAWPFCCHHLPFPPLCFSIGSFKFTNLHSLPSGTIQLFISLLVTLTHGNWPLFLLIQSSEQNNSFMFSSLYPKDKTRERERENGEGGKGREIIKRIHNEEKSQVLILRLLFDHFPSPMSNSYYLARMVKTMPRLIHFSF